MDKAVIIPVGVSIILIFCGYIIKNSKVLFTIQMFWMWVLIAFNSGGIDYKINENIFLSSTQFASQNEFGGYLYILLCNLFQKAGLDFVIMNFCISSIIIIFIYFFIKRNTKNICVVMSFLLIYPFFDNIIQKRWFLASIVMVYFIKYLFYNTKKGILVYIAGCFLATMIHIAALGYLFFVVFKFVPEKKMKKAVGWFLAIIIISIPIIPNLAMRIFPYGKISLYFYTYKIGLLHTVFWILFQSGYIFLCLYGIKKFSNLNIEFTRITKNINLLSVLLLPLFFYEPTFLRYFRSFLIYNYIEMANTLPDNNKYRKNIFIYYMANIGYAVLAFVIVYIIGSGSYTAMFQTVYKYNFFLQHLFGGRF